MPCILNAANEMAVNAFFAEKIGGRAVHGVCSPAQRHETGGS